MSKRPIENGQLRKEELEELDSESEESRPITGFEKASSADLAKRKIVKITRNVRSSTTMPVVQEEPIKVKNNPFAALGNVLLTSTTKSIPSIPISSIPTVPNDSVREQKNQSSEYMEKMKKLNSSFVDWMENQIVDHPVAIWTAGVKDYIKHCENLSKKYPLRGESSIISPISSNTKDISENQSTSTFLSMDVPVPVSMPTSAPVPEQSKTLMTAEKSVNEVPKSSWLSFPPSQFNDTSTKPFTFPKDSNKSSDSLSSDPVEDKTKSSSIPSTSTLPPFQFGQSLSNNNNTSSSTPAFHLPTFNLSNVTKPLTFNFNAPPAFPPLSNIGIGNNNNNSGFSLPTLNMSNPPSTNDGGGNRDGGNDDDDEGEPILAPEKALRNEKDLDEILYEAPSKLMRFDKGSKEWKDMGKGNFRISKNPDTGKPRMLTRNLTGKIMFNAGFYENMKFEKVKGGVKFSAITATSESSTDGELNLYIVKIKDSETAYEKLISAAKLV